jgi:hypothetical protein
MEHLKIGILINNLHQENLNGEIINNILKNKSINFDTIIVNKKSKKKNIISSIKKYTFKRIVEKILFKILTKIEKFFFNIFFKNFHFHNINLSNCNIKKIYVTPIGSDLDMKQIYSDEDIKKIKERGLDVILRLEGGILKGQILNITKHGVISFHHADNNVYRGLPPGFWEVFHKNSSTGFVVQKLNEELDGGDVVFKGTVPTKFFFYYNQQFVFKQSAKYINLVFKKLSESKKINYIVKKEYQNKIFKDPNLFELGVYCFSTFKIVIEKIFRKVFSKKYIWNIGFLREKFNKKNLKNINIFKNLHNRFIADPFLIKHDKKNYVFVEDYCFKNKKGSISCFLLEDNKEKFLGKVIEEKFHLSFPFLFKFNEKIYMCPETSEINEIRIYECLEFPTKWKYKKTLIKNIFAVDTLLFKKDSKWWLLTNTDSNNINYSSELSIFYSNEGPLTENWNEHKNNPLIVDANNARNGGLIFDNNEIYRVNQKIGYNIYGAELDVNLIKEINEENYVEDKIYNIKPNFLKNTIGVHHLSYNDEYSVIDFLKSS